MRAPLLLGASPANSSKMPAFCSSSVYLSIATSSSRVGGWPASASLVALTIIMNFIAVSSGVYRSDERGCAGSTKRAAVFGGRLPLPRVRDLVGRRRRAARVLLRAELLGTRRDD